MACYVGPNEDVAGVSWIHSDCTDRTARGNRTRERGRIGSAGGGPCGAARDKRPCSAAVRGLVKTHAGFGITRAVRLTGSHVDRVRVVRIKRDRTDGI